MNATRMAVVVVALCCLTIAGYSQRLSLSQREILTLQDERSLGGGTLVSYLKNKERDLRYRAAIALGNIQDTSTVDPLLPLLQDEDLQVRAAAAFALGQMGSPSAVRALVGALRSEQDLTVLARIFEALGKCGDRQALEATVSYIPPGRSIAVKRDQALSIARFAIRKIVSDRGVMLCFDLLNDNHADTRWAASYALWRLAPLAVLDREISKRPDVLQKLMNDRDEEVRINLAALLGRTKSDEAPDLVKLFCAVEAKAPDWRVQVQLARAAAALAPVNSEMLNIVSGFLESTNDHVRIAAIAALGGVLRSTIEAYPASKDILSTLRRLSATATKNASLVQGESIVTFAKLFPREFMGSRDEIRKTLKSNLLQAKYIEAVSTVPTVENLHLLLEFLADDSLRIQMAAWEAIRVIVRSCIDAHVAGDSVASSVPLILVARMRASLDRRDMALTALVAAAFTDSTVYALCDRAGLRSEIATAFRASYGLLSSRTDLEAIQALQGAFRRLRDTSAVAILEQSLRDENRAVAEGAAQTLLYLTGKAFVAVKVDTVGEQRRERNWRALESLPNGQRIIFRTTKGVFSIRLRKDIAPFTALTFYELVKKKFYDGLTFHRVVPDFVIQGGDPRGDGWGGPGFSIRSEWSLINFVRGSVGLASSGKDTEGCQFFITHVPTPHLDGRYTNFATVSSGMDVVDKIQVGDKILSAEAR